MPALHAVPLPPPRQPVTVNGGANNGRSAQTRTPLAMGTQHMLFDSNATTTTTTTAVSAKHAQRREVGSRPIALAPSPPPQPSPPPPSLHTLARGSLAYARSRRVAPLPLPAARAHVRPPLRPDTPLELLSLASTTGSSSSSSSSVNIEHTSKRSASLAATTGVLQPSRRRGTRLTALRRVAADKTTTTATAITVMVSASQLVESAAAAAPIVPDHLVAQLRSVYNVDNDDGNGAVVDVAEHVEQQVVCRVHDLMRWLAHPHHTLWPQMIDYAQDVMQTTTRALLLQQQHAQSRGATTLARRAHIAVVMASLLLRHTTLPTTGTHAHGQYSYNNDDSDSDTATAAALSRTMCIAATLRAVAECGATACLYDELVLDPLCHLLDSDVLFAVQPTVLHDVLAILLACLHATPSSSSQTRDEDDDDDDATMCGDDSSNNSNSALAQLVTLGVLPRVNALVTRLLQQQHDDSNNATTADVAAMHVTLARDACLLYRVVASRYAHHLCAVGTLPLLTQLLDRFAACRVVVEAAARVLAKVAFDDDGRAALCGDAPRVASSVMRALLAHIRNDAPDETQQQQQQSVALLVSRLCSALARLGEDAAALRDAVAQHGTTLLTRLLQRYVLPVTTTLSAASEDVDVVAASTTSTTTTTTTTAAALPHPQPPLARGTLTLVQDVVWLVGVVARSDCCTASLVWRVLPPVVSLLQRLAYTPATRLTCIYALMCVGNLSYWLAAMETQTTSLPDASCDDDNDDSNNSNDNNATALTSLYDALGLVVAGYLFEGDVEATVEATRILGNVSFTRRGRDWLERHRCDEVVVLFLGHENLRIVYNCFGVVLNLTAATSCRLVVDAELLAMLLQYTGRYTRQADVDALATRAAQQQQQQRDGRGSVSSNRVSSNNDDDDEDDVRGYAHAIAELVAKVLENVRGLVLSDAPM